MFTQPVVIIDYRSVFGTFHCTNSGMVGPFMFISIWLISFWFFVMFCCFSLLKKLSSRQNTYCAQATASHVCHDAIILLLWKWWPKWRPNLQTKVIVQKKNLILRANKIWNWRDYFTLPLKVNLSLWWHSQNTKFFRQTVFLLWTLQKFC